MTVASMRPPEFTGGNPCFSVRLGDTPLVASMRPPEFTGGNTTTAGRSRWRRRRQSFNEAAGIHRRKRLSSTDACFNDAAGIHRRKLRFMARGGFNEAAGIHRRKLDTWIEYADLHGRFNEAAGIHRRKRPSDYGRRTVQSPPASMRPPEFTGGNQQTPREVIRTTCDRSLQ